MLTWSKCCPRQTASSRTLCNLRVRCLSNIVDKKELVKSVVVSKHHKDKRERNTYVTCFIIFLTSTFLQRLNLNRPLYMMIQINFGLWSKKFLPKLDRIQSFQQRMPHETYLQKDHTREESFCCSWLGFIIGIRALGFVVWSSASGFQTAWGESTRRTDLRGWCERVCHGGTVGGSLRCCDEGFVFWMKVFVLRTSRSLFLFAFCFSSLRLLERFVDFFSFCSLIWTNELFCLS